MADYPKFTFDKCKIPEFPPELSEELKEYERRMMQHLVPDDDCLAPKMSFKKFRELMAQRRGASEVEPKIVFVFNPKEGNWLTEFIKEHFKDNV